MTSEDSWSDSECRKSDPCMDQQSRRTGQTKRCLSRRIKLSSDINKDDNPIMQEKARRIECARISMLSKPSLFAQCDAILAHTSINPSRKNRRRREACRSSNSDSPALSFDAEASSGNHQSEVRQDVANSPFAALDVRISTAGIAQSHALVASNSPASLSKAEAPLHHQHLPKRQEMKLSPFAEVDNYISTTNIAQSHSSQPRAITLPMKPTRRTCEESVALVDACIGADDLVAPAVETNVAPLFRQEHRQSNAVLLDTLTSEENHKPKLRKRSNALKSKARSMIEVIKSDRKPKLRRQTLPEIDELLEELPHVEMFHSGADVSPANAENASLPQEKVAAPLRLPALSVEQQNAVNMPFDKPLLVFAGPGSGKTLFLSCRIAQAVCSSQGQATCVPGACGNHIVAVTFTQRAASELQQRVGRLCASNATSAPWVGTLHGLALRLLRESGDRGRVVVATDADRRDLIAGPLGCIPDLHLPNLPGMDEARESDSDETPIERNGRKHSNSGRVSRIAKMLSHMKRNPKQWTSAVQQNPALGAARQNFDKELSSRGFIDIDDILPHALMMLKESPKAQNWARENVQKMFVDEWQDVDVEEANFLFHLCQGHTAVTAVGDDDQKIYGWRRTSKGMTPAAEFLELWPSAIVMTLSMNFRSLPAIVSAASKLIAHNTQREAKDFRAIKAGSLNDNSVRVVLKDSVVVEAQWIGEEIQCLRGKACDAEDSSNMGRLRPWSCFAVVARTNAAIKMIEEQLLQAGLPTRPARGNTRDPSKSTTGLAMLAYLRLIIDEEHDASFLRVFNLPKRGLGKASLRYLRQICRAPTQEQAGSPLSGIQEIDPVAIGARANEQFSSNRGYMASVRRLLSAPWSVPPKIAQGFASLQQAVIAGRAAARQAKSAAEVGRVVLEAAGLLHTDADAKNDIIFERLLAEAAKYKPDEMLRNGAACVAQFLKDGAGTNAKSDCICVSTIHAAKGLEWDIVFVAQCCETVMPLQKTIVNEGADLESELEEERRLFYVAMTRAREQLILTCGVRSSNGQAMEPSRFLSEAGLVDAISNGSSSAQEASTLAMEQQDGFAQQTMQQVWRAADAAQQVASAREANKVTSSKMCATGVLVNSGQYQANQSYALSPSSAWSLIHGQSQQFGTKGDIHHAEASGQKSLSHISVGPGTHMQTCFQTAKKMMWCDKTNGTQNAVHQEQYGQQVQQQHPYDGSIQQRITTGKRSQVGHWSTNNAYSESHTSSTSLEQQRATSHQAAMRHSEIAQHLAQVAKQNDVATQPSSANHQSDQFVAFNAKHAKSNIDASKSRLEQPSLKAGETSVVQINSVSQHLAHNTGMLRYPCIGQQIQTQDTHMLACNAMRPINTMQQKAQSNCNTVQQKAQSNWNAIQTNSELYTSKSFLDRENGHPQQTSMGQSGVAQNLGRKVQQVETTHMHHISGAVQLGIATHQRVQSPAHLHAKQRSLSIHESRSSLEQHCKNGHEAMMKQNEVAHAASWAKGQSKMHEVEEQVFQHQRQGGERRSFECISSQAAPVRSSSLAAAANAAENTLCLELFGV